MLSRIIPTGCRYPITWHGTPVFIYYLAFVFILLNFISKYLSKPYLYSPFDVVILQDEIEVFELLADWAQFRGDEVVFIEPIGEILPSEKVYDVLILD